MLNVFEKVATGIAAFCVIVALIPYLFWGPPSTRAKAFIPKVTPVTNSAPPRTSPGGAPTPPRQVLTQSDKEIIAALKTQNPRFRSSRVTRDTYNVPHDLFEEISKDANLIGELKTAHSEPLKVTKDGPATRLRVFNIAHDSYLRNFGIQDDDIIELVDGAIVEFSEDSSSALYGIFREKISKLRRGEAISLTVSRDGRSLHLEFKLPAR